MRDGRGKTGGRRNTIKRSIKLGRSNINKEEEEQM